MTNRAPTQKADLLGLIAVHALLIADLLFSARLYRVIEPGLQPILLLIPIVLIVVFGGIALLRGMLVGPIILAIWVALVFHQVQMFADVNGRMLNWNAAFQFTGPATFIVFLVFAARNGMAPIMKPLIAYSVAYLALYILMVAMFSMKLSPISLDPLVATDPERGARIFGYGSAELVGWYWALATLKNRGTKLAWLVLLVAGAAIYITISRVFTVCLGLVSVLYVVGASKSTIRLVTFTGFALVGLYFCYGLIDPSWNPYDPFGTDSSGAYRRMEYELAKHFIQSNILFGSGIAGASKDLDFVLSGSVLFSSDLGIVGVWFDFGLVGVILFTISTWISCSFPARPELSRPLNDALFLAGCTMALFGCLGPAIWYGSGLFFGLILAGWLARPRLAQTQRDKSIRSRFRLGAA